MIERKQPDPQLEALLDLSTHPSPSPDILNQITSLVNDSRIVALLASRYWDAVIDRADGSRQAEDRLSQDKEFHAAAALLAGHRKKLVEPVKRIMNLNYSFPRAELERYSPDTLVSAFFDVFPYIQRRLPTNEMEKKFIMRRFTVPLEIFGGRSRLQAIEDGDLELVITHGKSMLAGSAT